MAEKPLAGRLAVVTGASRGIGWAIAERLAADGAEVVGTATAAGAAMPQGCRAARLDLADAQSVEDFAVEVERLAPHILVNNAGVSKPQMIDDLEEEEFRRVHRINLMGPMRLCKAAVPGMKRHGWGRIVNISSIWGPSARPARETYAATKAGLYVMTAAIAFECAEHGVLANCVAPGPIETDILRNIYTPEALHALAQSMPMKRLGRPQEIAALVAFLAGPENTYMTGQNLVVDGGFTRFC